MAYAYVTDIFSYTKTEGFSDDESPSVLFVYRKILICSGKSPGIEKHSQYPRCEKQSICYYVIETLVSKD